jgi:hypothetical protein
MRVTDVDGREVGYLDTIVFEEIVDESGDGGVGTIDPGAKKYEPRAGYFIGTSDDLSTTPNLIYALSLVDGKPHNKKFVCVDIIRKLKIREKRHHL